MNVMGNLLTGIALLFPFILFICFLYTKNVINDKKKKKVLYKQVLYNKKCVYFPRITRPAKGGQFSAKNRGRPLWKAPYMIINTKILCGLFKLDDDVYGQPLI